MIETALLIAESVVGQVEGPDWGRAFEVFGIGLAGVFIIMLVLMLGTKATSAVIKKIEAGKASSK